MTIFNTNSLSPAQECLAQLLDSCSRSNPSFQHIVSTTDPTVLSEALLLKDGDGETLLHDLATRKNSSTCIALINSLSAETLTPLLQAQDMYGKTPLHRAAGNSNSDIFIALMNKLSPEALTAALRVKNMHGDTFLHSAAANSNSGAFIALMNKLSPETLTAALRVKNTHFRTPLNGLSLEMTIALIPKASDETIHDIIVNFTCLDHIPPDLVKALLHRFDTVSGLSLLDRDNWRSAIRYQLIDSVFDENLANIHQKFFTNKMAFTLSDEIWSEIKKGKTLLPDIRLRMQLMTVLMARPAFSLTRDQMSFFLYLKKTTSVKENWINRLIDQHLENRPLSAMIFSRDENQDAEYCEILRTAPAHIPDHCFDEAYRLTLKIAKNEILIKIIAPDNYDDYLKQLKDYNYRPKIRTEIPHAEYKFVHLTGKVVAYRYHNQKNKAAYTHTKKSSATVLGKDLKTPVFGHHDPRRPLVGYLFNKEDCVIKAMLKQDIGTYEHHWLTRTEDVANRIAPLIGEYNFTDEKKFLDEVNTNPSRTNEVLVKVKKEAIVAIVVARKDYDSVSIAKGRQKDAREKLGLDLPIVFYDSNDRSLTMEREKVRYFTQRPKMN